MARTLDLFMGDGDALLFMQFIHQCRGIGRGGDTVIAAVDDQTRGRAGRRES